MMRILPLSRQFGIVLLALLLGAPVAFGQNPVVDASNQAVARRQQQLKDAEQKMFEGDRRYSEQDYAGALESYRAAFLNTPNMASAQQFQLTVFQKYQEVLPIVAEDLAKQGRSEQAIAQVDQFFQDAIAESVPISALDTKTRYLLKDLKAATNYEPALTPKHVENVQQVNAWFREAEGAVDLGNYDLATELYGKILNVDPNNSAARRGMERVDKMVTAYYNTAYNQTRAKMLNEVAAGWENPVPRYSLEGLPGKPDGFVPGVDRNSLEAKLVNIVLPSVEFEQTPLREVVEFLRFRSRSLDTTETDPSKQGVNILLSNEAQDLATIPITLKLGEVALGVALDYVADLAKAKVRIDQFAVLIVPLTAPDSGGIITKTYRVPPDFLSGSATGGGGGDPFANDPFASLGSDNSSGALQPELTAKEFLEQNGVTFPPGASAKYIPETSTLFVRNTQGNIDFIESIVERSFETIEKLLKVDVRLLQVTDDKLKAFGFDWLLGQSNIPGNQGVLIGGGTVGTTRTSQGASDAFPFPINGQNNVTSPLRFDADQIFGDRIDQRLISNVNANINEGTGAVFSIAGVMTDPQFQVVLRALDHSLADDLSTVASVVTRPGQIASVRNVRELIYPTEYDPPEIPDINTTIIIDPFGGITEVGPDTVPITPAHPAAFDTRDVGVVLEVEGTVSEDNTLVSLNLTPEVVEFEGFVNYGTAFTQFQTDPLTGDVFPTVAQPNQILMPIFKTVRETTSINIYDGHTIVIGGLVSESSNMVHDKLPVLGDAPFVGNLFRSEIENRQRQSTLFFVTVNVIDPSGARLIEKSAPTAELTSN